MDTLTLDDLRELTRPVEGPCVSLLLPTLRAGPGTRQNPVRLKNLLRDAEDRLRKAGMRTPDAGRLLAPASELLEHPFFWQHVSDGLGVFLRPGWFGALRLPIRFAENVVVSARFHVTPLLPLLTDDGRFLVLALSQNEIRLLEGTRHGVREMELEHVPAGLEEALRYDDLEKEHLFHIAGRSGSPGTRAVFHGHGIGDELEKERIFRYFRRVDRGLHDVLRNERAPMVLAGVEYLLPIYREANSYAHLLEEAVPGNPETLRAEELRDRAWAIVEPLVLRRLDAALARYAEVAANGRASHDLEAILESAEHGRVEALFVAASEQRWGAVNRETGEVKVHEAQEPGDEELLGLATIRTLLARGTVHVLPPERVPDGGPAAAIMRF